MSINLVVSCWIVKLKKKPRFMVALRYYWNLLNYQLVEAAGIEPASVNPLPQVTTCLAESFIFNHSRLTSTVGEQRF